MKKHIVIPDTQIKPGVSLNHLNALGNYIVDTKPDVIVQLGDFADMHSLSSYDRGKLKGEGDRYHEDINAAKKGMSILLRPLIKYNQRMREQKHAQYLPKLILTLGNHENRINRHVDSNPVLHGHLGVGDLDYKYWGWDVIPFLETIRVDGITYSHYFPRNAQGRIVQTFRGSPSAAIQVVREAGSCTSGHLQGLDVHFQQRANRIDIGIIAGSFYMHEEDFLSPQGTAYWRGVVVKHEVQDGQYDPMFVSMRYLLDQWWDGEEYAT